jgi:hypothetical protein
VVERASDVKYFCKTVSLFRNRAEVDFCLDDELSKAPTQPEMISWSRGLGEDALIEEYRVLKLPDL